MKKAHRGFVFDLEFSHDGKTLVSSGADNIVRIWEIDRTTDRLIELTQLPSKAAWHCAAISSDGALVATGGGEDVIRIWNWHEHKIIWELPIPNWRSQAVAFSPDGTKLAAHCDRKVLIWDLGQLPGKRPAVVDGDEFVTSWTGLVFSPDSRRLAASWGTKGVQLIDVETEDVLHLLIPSSPSIVEGISFSPDGMQLAAGDQKKTVTIWDAASGAVVTELRRHHSNMISCVRFTSDGSALVSSSLDRTVRIWPFDQVRPPNAPPKVLGQFRGGSRIAVSANGLWLAATGRDGPIVLWDQRS